eukprot:scaffold1519_cov424-Pavlova_lutheri.AAC.2
MNDTLAQRSTTALARRGTPTDPSSEPDRIASSRTGNRLRGYGLLVKKIELVTENKTHRMRGRGFECPRYLPVHAYASLQCLPEKVAQGLYLSAHEAMSQIRH